MPLTLSTVAGKSSIALSNGNKTATNNSGAVIEGYVPVQAALLNFSVYWECVADVVPAGESLGFGLAKGNSDPTSHWLGETTDSAGYYNNGNLYRNGSSEVLATFAVSDVIGFFYDYNNLDLWISKNGSWLGSGSPNPSTLTDPTVELFLSEWGFLPVAPAMTPYNNTAAGTIRTEESEFSYSIPSGGTALCAILDSSGGGGGGSSGSSNGASAYVDARSI